MKNLLLIGQAEEIDPVQPQVRAMLENEGVYIGGDSKQPELTVILFSQAGKIICMKPDMELAPDRFLDTLTLHGPYSSAPPAQSAAQGLSESEISDIAGGCMDTARYNLFMSMVQGALRKKQ